VNVVALIFLILLAAYAALALFVRADVARRPGRIAQYSAPAGMNLLTAAVLDRSEKRAVAAELVNLAVRGNIRFLAPDAGRARKGKGARRPDGLGMELLDGPPLDAEQHELLVTLFGAGRSSKRLRRFLRRDAKLGRALRSVQQGVAHRLEQAGLVGRLRRWPALVLRFACVLSFIVFVIAALVGPEAGLWVLLAVPAAAMMVTAIWAMPAAWRRLPPASFELRDHLAGLRDYIELAEADRLRFLQSPDGALRHGIDTPDGRMEVFVLNEKLLPYAVLFGQEREWAKVLETEHRELAASGVLDTLDALDALYTAQLIVEFGLTVAELDVSLLDGIDLSGIDLSDLSFDL
jgi:hypothetical protein